MRNFAIVCVVALVLAGMCQVVLTPDEASAFPTFSRKYKTSCQTCHVAYPKLTPFGEAFRQNGYRFPQDDAGQVKDEPVSLGSEGYKKVWPDAVWPTNMPGMPPISFITEAEYAYTPKSARRDAGVATADAVSFNNAFAEVELITGGAFDEHISFLAMIEFMDGNAPEFERGFVSLDDIFSWGWLNLGFNGNLRIGQFDPGVFSFSNHRRFGPTYNILSGNSGQTNNFTLEASQRGFELNGILGEEGRWRYNTGVVEGRGGAAVNNHKDWYGHLAYKLGGTRFDGQGGTPGDKPWRDDVEPTTFGFDAIQLGGMVWRGEQEIDAAQQQDKFKKWGGDINASMGDLNIFGAYVKTKYGQPLTGSTDDFTQKQWMGEGHYVYKPWLIPYVRFESNRVTRQNVTGLATYTKRFVPGIVFLLRPNVKVEARAIVAGNAGQTYAVDEGNLILKIGF